MTKLTNIKRIDSWEKFGTSELLIYFSKSKRKFQLLFSIFTDLSLPVCGDIEKELSFMLESLIQARKLMEEIEIEKIPK